MAQRTIDMECSLMNSRFLILVEADEKDWAVVEWKKNNIETEIVFKSVNRFLRAIRRVYMHSFLPCKHIWYGAWKDKIKDYDCIIVHVTHLNMHIPKYINTVSKDTRVIAWYWDAVKAITHPKKIKGECEKWSFDRENCEKFGLNFNHQYYFKSLQCKNKEIKYDLCFCGTDSGRGEIIRKVYNTCKEMGLKLKFRVVYSNTHDLPEEILSKPVPYSTIQDDISESRAILELLRDGQSGSTIRMMEAVYDDKKLVTNNQSVKDEEFYDESRIFVLGERDICDLPSFLNERCLPYSEEVKDYYDVHSWIKRFGIL